MSMKQGTRKNKNTTFFEYEEQGSCLGALVMGLGTLAALVASVIYIVC